MSRLVTGSRGRAREAPCERVPASPASTGPQRRWWWRRRLITFLVVLAVAGGGVGAWAYFGASATAGSAAESDATSVNQGATPSVSPATIGRQVHVTWGASTLANGRAVDGYVVTRYPMGGGAGTINPFSTCGGTVTGTSCDESFVPPGSWQYTITPVIGTNWRGAEGALSGAVTVGPETLSVNGSPFGNAAFMPAVASATGSIGGFGGHEGVSYNLDSDSPPSGTALTGSPSTVGQDGSASMSSLLIPRSAGEGSHTVWALGDGNYQHSKATAGIVIDTVAPSVSASLSPAANGAGWNNSSVQVTLSESDPAPSAGSGTITYTTDGSDPTSSGTAVTYAAPFTINAQGTTTVKFYGSDAAGNSPSVATQLVKIDTTPPTNSISLNLVSGNAVLSGSTLWYRGVNAGSFTLSNAVTDALSGPASSSYAAVSGTTTGWSFTSSSSTAGPSYGSNTFSWSAGTSSSPSETVTAFDVAGNFTAGPVLTFTNDSAGPTGGSVDATGLIGTGSRYSNSLTLSIASSKGTDAGVGLSTSGAQLLRAEATLSSPDGVVDGICSTYGSFALVASDPTSTYSDSVPDDNACYKYEYVVPDKLGNTTSYTSGDIKVETAAPNSLAPTPTLSSATGNTFVNGATVYINPQSGRSGSFQASASATDPRSGVLNVVFPSLTGFTIGGGTVSSSPFLTTYTWSGAGATGSGPQTVTAKDNATLTNIASFTVTPDTMGPAGGALTVNGTAATGGGSSSLTNGSSFAIAVRTDYNADAGAGVASSVLTEQYAPWTSGTHVCGSFGSTSTITDNPTQTEPSGDGCYKYTLTGTDNVGNTSTVTTTVKVDTTAPTTTIAINPASPNGSLGWYKTTAPTFTLGATDSGSGVASTVYKIDGGSTQTYSSAVSIPEGQHTISYWSIDLAGNTESTNTSGTIKVDTVGPTDTIALGTSPAGAFLSGTTLYYKSNTSGSFTLADTVSDVTSGPASATFPAISTTGWTHAAETVSTPSGGPYPSTTFSWTASPTPPSSKTITSTDTAGNTGSGIAISFASDTTGPTGGVLTVNGTAATSGGSSSLTKASSYAIGVRTDYNADAGSGVASSVLTVAYAPWNSSTHVCGSFGSASTISNSPTQTEPSGDGCYKYTLTGTDNVGNTSAVTTTVQVDTTVPVTTDNTGSIGNGWKNTTQTVTLTPTDSGSGVAQTHYTTDGSTPTTSSSTGTSISLSATGQYTIKYFSVDNTGNSEAVKTAGTVIRIDKVAPTDSVSLSAASGAFLNTGTNTLYFNKNTGGSFKLADAVTDNDSGPASATFPGISATGWTGHTTSDTVSSGSGSPPTITYTSSTAYSFSTSAANTSGTVTSKDIATNTNAAVALTLTADTTAPSGGSVTVPAFVNTASVQVSFSAGTDTGSGVNTASGQLSRASATYTSGSDTCGTFGSFANIGSQGVTSPFADTSVSSNTCYEYKYTASDNVGNSVTYTSGSVAIDTVAPTINSVTLANGGTTAGKIEKGDTITVVFSEQMSVSGFCSTWTSGDTNNQSLTVSGDVTVTLADGGAGNDTISVTSGTCTFNFGSINLGSTAYVTGGSLTFNGSGSTNKSTITWTASSHTLVITLGAQSGSGTPGTVTASTATYTPSGSLTDSAGNAVSGTGSTGSVKNF